MMTNDTQGESRKIMDAIRTRGISMRPRWHFVLFSALSLLGALIALLTLVYAASLAIYFLRESGALYAPSFGARGWWVLVREMPWLLIACIAVFAVILHVLVRRYAFVYRAPLMGSLLIIIAVMLLGGFLVSTTPLHRMLLRVVHRGGLPPLALMYEGPMRGNEPPGVLHGSIIATTSNGFVMVDESGAGTTSIVVTPRTRLPLGGMFTLGERVIVIGNTASGTMHAYGVSAIGQ